MYQGKAFVQLFEEQAEQLLFSQAPFLLDAREIPVTEQTNEQWLAAYDAAQMLCAASESSTGAQAAQTGTNPMPVIASPQANAMNGPATSSATQTMCARRLEKIPNVSWWHIVVALEQHGYRHSDIAASVGVSRSAVEGWKNRFIEPSHPSGESLLALWRVVTGMVRQDVPVRTETVLSAAGFRSA